MSRINFLILLFGAFFVSSCAAAPIPGTDPAGIPVLEGDWVIHLAQSGGIMGMSQAIEVRSDGAFTASDLRSNKTQAGQLSEEQLSQLVKDAASAEYSSVEGPEKYACADCFVYDLEISAAERSFSVQLSDVSLPGSGLQSLVMDLREPMSAALK